MANCHRTTIVCEQVGAPPLAMCLNYELLCVANDSGDVALIDKNSMIGRHKWTAHFNAIFDVKWRKGFEHHLGTASGDKSIIIWDTNTRKNFNEIFNSIKEEFQSKRSIRMTVRTMVRLSHSTLRTRT